MSTIQNENGRSMIEMLGVLAIMGVLTVGGLAGYDYANNKSRANDLLYNVSQAAIILSQQATSGVIITDTSLQSSFGTAFGDYPFKLYGQDNINSNFEIEVDEIPDDVCKLVLRDNYKQAEAISLGENIIFEYGEKKAEPSCASDNKITWEFNPSLSVGQPKEESEDEGEEEEEVDLCADADVGDCGECNPETGEVIPIGSNCLSGTCLDDLTCEEEGCSTADDCPYPEDQKCENHKCLYDFDGYCRDSGHGLAYVDPDDEGNYCYECFTGDTPITLADGTCKRADEITYDDDLLVWNFDEGHFDVAKPLWLKVPEKADKYNYLKFSDGSVLKTINQHRIFNRELGKFTYPMTDETPIGTTTLNARGEWVTLVDKAIIYEAVKFYDIITDFHINCFAGNVLTSCRLSNLYPIQDLKYIKDNRKLIPYSDYSMLNKSWYDGLRLAEQPHQINRGNDVKFGNTLIDYVQHNLISKMALADEQAA